jgi:hypothetical protein
MRGWVVARRCMYVLLIMVVGVKTMVWMAGHDAPVLLVMAVAWFTTTACLWKVEAWGRQDARQ